MTAPPFAYFGGKTTAARRIVSHLPAHLHYVEPFAGSLAVLLAKPRSRMETVNDLDRAIVTFWRVLRERPDELARACQLTPHSRAEWEDCKDVEASTDDLETARRLWVRLSQSRTGRLVRAGWRHYVSPGAVSTAFPSYLDGYVDRTARRSCGATGLRHLTCSRPGRRRDRADLEAPTRGGPSPAHPGAAGVGRALATVAGHRTPLRAPLPGRHLDRVDENQIPVRAQARDTRGEPDMTEDFQDAGEQWRQRFGIDGTAGDAQDVEHPFVAEEPGGGCIVCGFAGTYRKHAGDAGASA